MFTGLIETTGRIDAIEESAGGRRIRVATALATDLRPGDSIAVSGVCLTVTTADGEGFTADLSRETLRVTALSTAGEGGLVNLERPIRADARVGGHFVLGHVDATGRIEALRPDGDGHWLEVQAPAALAPLLIPKGSIAIDGISLTIASLAGTTVGAQIVPFTFAHTALRQSRVGDAVNIEADVLGKYVARALALQREPAVATSMES